MAEKLEGRRNRRQLVLVPLLAQGHFNPMLQLATILGSKGFRILVAVPHPISDFPTISNHPEFTFLALSDSKPETSDDLIIMLSEYERNCTAPLEDLLTQITTDTAVEEERPCVIHDQLMYFAKPVVDKLKLPSIVLNTSSAAFDHSTNAYPLLPEKGCLPKQESRSLELVPGLYPLRFKDFCVLYSRSSDALEDFMAKTEHTRACSAMIWNSFEFLENSTLSKLEQQFRVPIFAIGPMHKMVPGQSFSFLKEDDTCITWLDKQIDKSVIYVSFGSLAFISKKDLEEIAWGLANSKQPFLWVIRPGSVQGFEADDPLLPDGFMQSVGEKGCIVKWASQKEVLAHKAVGGFWSHCGWNSIVESISEGVPMICSPFMIDQPVNARYVSHVWGVGFELENGFERGAVQKAVRRLMVDEEGQMLRQRAADLKAKTELSIREGGSSFNSLNKLVDFLVSV